MANLVVAVVHGAAHALRGVFPDQLLDIAVVAAAVYAGPVVALALLDMRRAAASLLLASSMAAALLYGAANHFLLAGADNVQAAGGGAVGLAFSGTALILAILEMEGAAVGALMLKDAWAARAFEVPQ